MSENNDKLDDLEAPDTADVKGGVSESRSVEVTVNDTSYNVDVAASASASGASADVAGNNAGVGLGG